MMAAERFWIGDYVLTGGELPALVGTDAVARLRPGVLGGDGAAERESFTAGLLEPPQYTRPEDFRGARVPDVLLSGDHARVARWRREQALWLTWRRRPQLLAGASLTGEERRVVQAFPRGGGGPRPPPAHGGARCRAPSPPLRAPTPKRAPRVY